MLSYNGYQNRVFIECHFMAVFKKSLKTIKSHISFNENLSLYFFILNIFFKNDASGQTTMLTRRVWKFCVEAWSPFSEISHRDLKTI